VRSCGHHSGRKVASAHARLLSIGPTFILQHPEVTAGDSLHCLAGLGP
jgi:hypothetical protein